MRVPAVGQGYGAALMPAGRGAPVGPCPPPTHTHLSPLPEPSVVPAARERGGVSGVGGGTPGWGHPHPLQAPVGSQMGEGIPRAPSGARGWRSCPPPPGRGHGAPAWDPMGGARVLRGAVVTRRLPLPAGEVGDVGDAGDVGDMGDVGDVGLVAPPGDEQEGNSGHGSSSSSCSQVGSCGHSRGGTASTGTVTLPWHRHPAPGTASMGTGHRHPALAPSPLSPALPHLPWLCHPRAPSHLLALGADCCCRPRPGLLLGPLRSTPPGTLLSTLLGTPPGALLGTPVCRCLGIAPGILRCFGPGAPTGPPGCLCPGIAPHILSRLDVSPCVPCCPWPLAIAPVSPRFPAALPRRPIPWPRGGVRGGAWAGGAGGGGVRGGGVWSGGVGVCLGLHAAAVTAAGAEGCHWGAPRCPPQLACAPPSPTTPHLDPVPVPPQPWDPHSPTLGTPVAPAQPTFPTQAPPCPAVTPQYPSLPPHLLQLPHALHQPSPFLSCPPIPVPPLPPLRPLCILPAPLIPPS